MEIPGYELLDRCGRGACGDVWMAEDRVGRRVALKVVERSDRADKELSGLRYYAGLKNFSRLIRIFHIGELSGAFFYTMELADSLEEDRYLPATLENVLCKRRRIPAQEVMTLANHLLDGLSVLHRAGLVHRDIKPGNILWVDAQIKLSDVGLIRSVSASSSGVGGTLGFIPPERLTSGVGNQSSEDDLYALGKVLYCMWTGSAPEKFPTIPAECVADPGAARLNAAIVSACAQNPTARFASVSKFEASLRDSGESEECGSASRSFFRRMIPAVLIACFLPSRPGIAPVVKTFPAPPNEPVLMEFTITGGTPESTVIKTVVEDRSVPGKRKAEEKMIQKEGRFSDSDFWTADAFVNVTRSFDGLLFESAASGGLILRKNLPENYRIAFRIDAVSLRESIAFEIGSVHRSERLVFRISGGGSTLQLTRPELYREGRRIALPVRGSPEELLPGSNEVTVTRRSGRIEIMLDKRKIYGTGPVFAGGRFRITAACGGGTRLSLTDFRVWALP